jgi:hypothetical protein
MKEYAISKIPNDADAKTKDKIIQGIEDAIYGLMMMMDGVVGSLQNDDYTVTIENNILLEKNGQVIQRINTLNGDGMCMGFHDWREGKFGEDTVTESN